MLVGLRADRPWAGAGVRSAVTRAAWTSLDRRGSPGVTLDEIDWTAARFQLSRWQGDPEIADPPGPRGLRTVAEGGREALWATPDPGPGIYLVSATLPRRHGRPFRAAVWTWFAPWDVSLYLPVPGAGAAGPATTAPTTAPSDAPVFPYAPPLGPVAERRTEPSLDFERWWFMNYGFGPARKPYGFTVSARATVLPPPGHYLLKVESDGVSRESLDGNVLTAVRQNGTVRTIDINGTDGRAGDFRLDWQATGDAWVVTLEPTGAAAEAARKAARDPMGDLEAEVDRLTSTLGPKGPDTAETLFNRGKALARLGLFDEAARDLRRMTELDPTQSYPAYIYASLLAWRGDRDACRVLARDMVARFGGGPRPEWREHACKVAALLPGLVDDPSGLPGMAEAALAAGADKQLVPWLKMARVMAEYRAGHDEAAADAGTDAVAALAPMKGAGLARAACHYFRAMALHRLGRADDANAAYDEAEREVAASDRVAGTDDLGDGTENWFVCHAVRREARAALGLGPETRPATRPVNRGG
jgi:tetratricopeptide (TPR) repeat protein